MVWKAALAISIALLAGCGGGSDATKAQVRMVNASAGYKELDLRVQDQVRQGGVVYGAAEGYIEIDPGKAASTISSAGSATPLLKLHAVAVREEALHVAGLRRRRGAAAGAAG